MNNKFDEHSYNFFLHTFLDEYIGENIGNNTKISYELMYNPH